MKDYSGSCEMCGADLSGGPETELAALRAELAAMTARAERAEALLGQILDAARRVVDCHTERPAETGQAIADMYDVLLDVENNEDGQP